MNTGGLRRAGRPTGVSPAIARRIRLAAAFSSPEGHFAAVPVLLGCVLVGYAFGGRAFADLGVAPIFIGEVALAVGVVATLVHRRRIAAFRSLLSVGILLFCLWGAIRTIPFLPVYGVDALRDAVIWGYAVFALLIPVYVTRLEHFETLARRYSQILPWFMAWVPIAMLIDRAAPGGLKLMKGGDAAVHLGGAAAFIILGLYGVGKRGAAGGRTWKELIAWALWPAAFLFAATANRGGLLSALVAILLVAAFWPAAAGRKLVLAGAVVGLIGLLLVAMERGSGGAGLATPHHGRSVAPSQLAENLMSVMADDADAPMSNTKIWRLLWWGDIVRYTVHGEYFWTGKGFGVNLADEDGYQLGGGTLRSPHNGHLTILARAGVPGALLWIGLQAAFGVSLTVAYIRARRAQHITWAKVNLWLLAYWAAFMANTTFDVYLEGPQGGIWFWSVVGLGIAALIAQREMPAAAPPVRWQTAGR